MDHDLIGSEYCLPPEEDKLPPEYRPLPDNEFGGYQDPPRAEEKDRHSLLKRLILMPLAASVSVIALLFSALGNDPLGTDFLVNGLVPASSETPAVTASPYTPEPGSTEGPTSVPTENPSDEPTEAPTEEPTGGWDDSFPELDNLDPDTAGEYAWSGEGSEEYVRLLLPGDNDYTYLEIGTVWEKFGDVLGSAPGATYDLATNTLTLENFTCEVLDVNLMGNGFKLNIIGTNRIGTVSIWGAMYGGSLTITGTGTLYVNEGGGSVGICLNSEWSQSCLMIDREVTVEVWGDQAIMISATSMDTAIYYLNPIELTGGECGILSQSTEDDGVYYDYTVLDDNGDASTHVLFTPKN